jgi:hypothetical protein
MPHPPEKATATSAAHGMVVAGLGLRVISISSLMVCKAGQWPVGSGLENQPTDVPEKSLGTSPNGHYIFTLLNSRFTKVETAVPLRISLLIAQKNRRKKKKP